ncbi:hypothetical protein GCK72_008430 [Caenorhabditis remanei]|uniref:Uncharacterized protein n=1 Tax=Caenorhabditis remanei TaxID=31234 RepID=A0A6A5H091_CAERE|nr:hypothetical protein GCK72_008430 [Caenorhabditis remanei]KAF1760184.1 hypothetical protein GCK72_008430 [Caenorhabditis remanei]
MASLLGFGTRVDAVVALVEDRLEVGDVIGATLTELGELVDVFLEWLLLVARHYSGERCYLRKIDGGYFLQWDEGIKRGKKRKKWQKWILGLPDSKYH